MPLILECDVGYTAFMKLQRHFTWCFFFNGKEGAEVRLASFNSVCGVYCVPATVLSATGNGSCQLIGSPKHPMR